MQSRILRIMFYGMLWTIMSLILGIGIHKYSGLQNRPIILKYTEQNNKTTNVWHSNTCAHILIY